MFIWHTRSIFSNNHIHACEVGVNNRCYVCMAMNPIMAVHFLLVQMNLLT